MWWLSRPRCHTQSLDGFHPLRLSRIETKGNAMEQSETSAEEAGRVAGRQIGHTFSGRSGCATAAGAPATERRPGKRRWTGGLAGAEHG